MRTVSSSCACAVDRRRSSGCAVGSRLAWRTGSSWVRSPQCRRRPQAATERRDYKYHVVNCLWAKAKGPLVRYYKVCPLSVNSRFVVILSAISRFVYMTANSRFVLLSANSSFVILSANWRNVLLIAISRLDLLTANWRFVLLSANSRLSAISMYVFLTANSRFVLWPRFQGLSLVHEFKVCPLVCDFEVSSGSK